MYFFHIGPLPWLVSGLLSSCLFGTYCTVYTVQCNVCTDNSLFFISSLAKPKQELGFNEIFNSKLFKENSRFKIKFLFCLNPLVAFNRLSSSPYGILSNFYCVQCNTGTVCLFDCPDYLSLN